MYYAYKYCHISRFMGGISFSHRLKKHKKKFDYPLTLPSFVVYCYIKIKKVKAMSKKQKTPLLSKKLTQAVSRLASLCRKTKPLPASRSCTSWGNSHR